MLQQHKHIGHFTGGIYLFIQSVNYIMTETRTTEVDVSNFPESVISHVGEVMPKKLEREDYSTDPFEYNEEESVIVVPSHARRHLIDAIDTALIQMKGSGELSEEQYTQLQDEKKSIIKSFIKDKDTLA